MAFDPIPVPVRGSATFNADAEAFAQGMSQFATDYNALSSVIDASLTSSSTTSLTIGTGSQVLTVQTGLGYVVGYPLRISSSASPTNYMDGIVTDYNTGTGSLTVNVLSVSGSGTIAAWNTMVLPGGGNFASLSYNKFTQRQVFANEVSIASASTIDFTAGNSNQFLITGTTSITAVTIDQGAVVKARFAAACTLTHGTNLQVQGGSSYTTAAGDIATFTSNGTVVRVELSKADGTAVVFNQLETTSTDATGVSTSDTKAATPAWVRLGLNVSLGSSGYIFLPKWLGGLGIQWASFSVGGAGTTGVTFPTAFTTSCYIVNTSVTYGGSGTPGSVTAASGSYSTTGFNLGSSVALSGNYIALGK